MILDFHTHIFSPEFIGARFEYAKKDLCFFTLYHDQKARLITAEELIKSMDESGVDRSVVLNIGWTSHQLCVKSNDYILSAASKYPNRLIPFCAIQPTAGKKAIQELERCAKNGAKGIGELRPPVQGYDINDSVMFPVVEALLAHKMLMLIHVSEPVGHQYPGKDDFTPKALFPFVVKNPGLKMVCAHWGGGLPFYGLMPEIKKALKTTYFDCAATQYLYSPGIFRNVMDIIGKEKVLFGTDYPLLSQKKSIDQINKLKISQVEREMILGINGQTLLA